MGNLASRIAKLRKRVPPDDRPRRLCEFTDAELQAIIDGRLHPRVVEIEAMTDAELEAIIASGQEKYGAPRRALEG
jgi:hypothetical protein